MKCAYAAQNHFGMLCDERVYENDVAARLRAEGFGDVFTQVPVTIRHCLFKKTYFLDLVVGQMVYEVKAESSLSAAHEAQALNYAALLGLNRIKLVSFGGESVRGKLLGAPFANMDRHNVSFDVSDWQPLGPECENLNEHAKDLVRGVGGYLSAELYRDALLEIHGGEQACVRRLPVSRDGIEMGTQRSLLHSDECAFVVSTVGTKLSTYVAHLHSLLSSLPIRGLQLINIHHCNVQFITVS
jgi:GxxExxY protein